MSVREKNKNYVIEVALDLFVKNGINNTKISEIAEAAGITERSIYRYFQSKSELVFQTAMLFWQDTTNQAEAALVASQNAEATGAQQIRVVLGAYAQQYFAEKEKLIFEQEAEIFLYKNDKVVLFENKPPTHYASSTAPLAKAIQHGVEDGTVRNDIDLETLYHNTYNALLGLMHKMAITEYDHQLGHGISAEKRLDVFCDTLLASFT